jgi:ADP-ribose pyrophosphatase YjhB (NUDIX family)
MNVHFCPNCGSSDIHKQNVTNFKCDACGYVIWNNPKTCVGVIFLKGDEILVSERSIAPNKGRYDFPGGFIEYNEDPYHAAIREIHEETSVEVERSSLQLLAAYTHEYLPGVSVVDLLFVVQDWAGKFTPQDDSADLVWKPISFIANEAFAPPYRDLASRLEKVAIKAKFGPNPLLAVQ